MVDSFDKADWHWTRKGWKRTPKHMRHGKLVPKVRKHRYRKKQTVEDAVKGEKPPTYAMARKLAAEKAKAVSAPTPAPVAKKPTTRKPRVAWHGKYNTLTPPKPEADPSGS